VTCHHGSSLHYGHYTSYVRGPDDSWFNADDDDVSPVSPKTMLHDKSAYLLSYMRVGKGEQVTSASPAASKAEASVASSPATFKRRREDESPSPQKRAAGPVRPPLASSYGANANGKAESSALSRLEKQYGSDSSDSDGMDAKLNNLAQPRPRRLDQPTSSTASPISRPHHPVPNSPKKFKNKFAGHRPNHKQGIEMLNGSANGHAHGNGHGHPHTHKKKPGALNPFAAGQKRSKSSNVRHNLAFAAREVSLMSKKGRLKGMRAKGM
jgi:hypothetical protein